MGGQGLWACTLPGYLVFSRPPFSPSWLSLRFESGANRAQVYCQQCFDNRRPTVRNKTKFRAADGSAVAAPQSKVLCAVEDCQSEVTSKTAWVGIFL